MLLKENRLAFSECRPEVDEREGAEISTKSVLQFCKICGNILDGREVGGIRYILIFFLSLILLDKLRISIRFTKNHQKVVKNRPNLQF